MQSYKNCKKQSTITPGSSTKWNPHPGASAERPQRIKWVKITKRLTDGNLSIELKCYNKTRTYQ